MEPLTWRDVQAALDRLNLDIRIHLYDSSTATSQMAADNIGCQLGQIAKSICFVVNDQPVLVIASGDQKVDDRKIAALLGVGRKQVKTATAEQCVEIFGYPPGSVPPTGHRTENLRVFVDESFGRFEQLYAAGGAHNAIFPVTLEQLLRMSGGALADVKKDNTQ